jgi:hypothetical protein
LHPSIGLKNELLVNAFSGVLKSFNTVEEYKLSPPQGPPQDLPTLSNDELKALQHTIYGEDLTNTGYAYHTIKLVESPALVNIPIPTLEVLKDINICGIDGSNQRVERGSFYFILTRASIVNFRYSEQGFKPYFYNRNIDASAVTWVDGNVFKDDVKLYTKTINTKNEDGFSLLKHLRQNKTEPLLVRYDPDKVDKSPSSHALGWAVKIQQSLELLCLSDVKTTEKTVCIKDGPLFSTSVSIIDVMEGLDPIFSWTNQILVACSKRIKDSTLLVEALIKNIDLRNYWFKDQNINDATLKSIATDSLLLPRILKPGQRTPLFAAVPVSRQKVVDTKMGGNPQLTPLSCYYLSRHRPHTYIRMEIPQFMWENDPKAVEEAIQIVAWQHEIGHKAPLVQLAADDRCQLQYEKQILEKQTTAALSKFKLDFPEEY